ncbi:MAG TPA: hypothetical protein VM681_06315 [Candidatus Thermoplasmatota archaeon]|nr:hypothetical protein [Candidatus Thermoplasmatota archaeon]
MRPLGWTSFACLIAIILPLPAAAVVPWWVDEPVEDIAVCTGARFCDNFRQGFRPVWSEADGASIEDDRLVLRAGFWYANLASRADLPIGDGIFEMLWNPWTVREEWKQFYVSFRYDPNRHWTTWHRVELRVDSNDLCYQSGTGGTCAPFVWLPIDYHVRIVHASGRVLVFVDGALLLKSTYPAGEPATRLLLTAADDGQGQRVDWVGHRPFSGPGGMDLVDPEELRLPYLKIRK